MGRHGDPGGRRRLAVGLLSLAAVIGVSAGAWAVVSTATDDAPAARQQASAGTTPSASAGASGDPVAAAPASDTPSAPAASASPVASQSPTADAAAGCVAEVRALEAVGLAAAGSARDWRMHTDAQLAMESGRYDLKGAQADWAASKARGPGDLARFTKATSAAAAVEGGCDAAEAEEEDPSKEVAACLERHAALKTLVARGTTVNDQWAAHIKMMEEKSDADPMKYHERWLGMVEKAQPALAAFDKAQVAVDRTPTCSA